jgi:hypothetical protein
MPKTIRKTGYLHLYLPRYLLLLVGNIQLHGAIWLLKYMIYIPKVWKGDYKETLWRREGNSGPTTLHNRRQLLFLVQCSATALSSCWKFPFSSHEKVDGMGWGWHTLNIVNPTYWCFQRDTIEENLNAQEAAELSTVLRRLVSFSHSVS